MPYRTVEDLPKNQVDQYNAHQKDAFLQGGVYGDVDHLPRIEN